MRQSIELININFNDFDAVVTELGEGEQKVASCGARVRVPVACGGCEYNPNGLVDTQRSAMEVDRELFGTETGHHKFKVAFSGCPFDCPKAAINDVGFIGAIRPELDRDECISCGLCAKSCAEGAIAMDQENKPLFSPDKCTYCGDCVKVCPTGAWKTVEKGYTVRIGGKWGRQPLIGTLYATFLPEEKVVEFIACVLAWYKEKAEGTGPDQARRRHHQGRDRFTAGPSSPQIPRQCQWIKPSRRRSWIIRLGKAIGKGKKYLPEVQRIMPRPKEQPTRNIR